MTGVGEYGVGSGKFVSIERDKSDDFGRYYHGHIAIGFSDQAGLPVAFEAAVDVNKPDGSIEYCYLKDLDPTPLHGVTNLAPGYHQLAKTATSGALDYHRAPLVNRPLGCVLTIATAFVPKKMAWTLNVGTAALEKLEHLFLERELEIDRVWLFGAAYGHPATNPPGGVHDAHCNQGDPPGPFQHLDGIWQDGGVIVRYNDTHWEGFFVKFATQTLDTNGAGLPLA